MVFWWEWVTKKFKCQNTERNMIVKWSEPRRESRNPITLLAEYWLQAPQHLAGLHRRRPPPRPEVRGGWAPSPGDPRHQDPPPGPQQVKQSQQAGQECGNLNSDQYSASTYHRYLSIIICRLRSDLYLLHQIWSASPPWLTSCSTSGSVPSLSLLTPRVLTRLLNFFSGRTVGWLQFYSTNNSKFRLQVCQKSQSAQALVSPRGPLRHTEEHRPHLPLPPAP